MVKQTNMRFIDGAAKPIPTFIEKENNGKPYVSYGIDNRFPNYLWDLYLRSAVLQSIVNGTSDFVAGNGINYSPVLERLSVEANKDGETLDDVIKKIATDYLIFGGFALQIIRNKLGDINELYWLDFRNTRINKEGDTVFYSEDWIKHANDYIKYDVFKDGDNKGTSVFYFKGHITRGTYPIPKYNGAIAAIETSTEISKFHLKSILNNFSGNFVINFNNGIPDEETQGEIEERIKEKFSGAENAGKFVLSFNDSKDNAMTVQRIPDDSFDKKYEALRLSTFKEIFISMRCQPQLFGFVIEGNLFNKEEYEQAYAMYKKGTVQPMQRDIVRTFNRIFNTTEALSFVDYSLEDTADTTTITEE